MILDLIFSFFSNATTIRSKKTSSLPLASPALTKLTKIFNGDYRVLWRNGDILGGYKDFPSKNQANNFINHLQNEYKRS